MTKFLTTLVVAVTVLFASEAAAQYSPQARYGYRYPEACNKYVVSETEYNIVRVYNDQGRCRQYDNSDFYRYERSRYYRSLDKQARLDPQHFFAFHNGADAPQVAKRQPPAPAAPSSQSSQEVAEPIATDEEELGACGLPVKSQQGREAQETLARDGACEIAKSYLR